MAKKKDRLVVVESTVTRSTYTSSSVVINVPKHDTDVELVMPDGNCVSIQLRVESDTMDICFRDKYPAYNWGEHMSPAKTISGEKHLHLVNQLCIDLGANKQDNLKGKK